MILNTGGQQIANTFAGNGSGSKQEAGNVIQDLFGVGVSSARVQNQMNRDFQERMANTQWQRGVEDMKKAGINPLSAFGGMSSAIPSGSSGVGGQSASAVSGILSNVIGSSAKLISDLSYLKSVKPMSMTDMYTNNLKKMIVTSSKLIK